MSSLTSFLRASVALPGLLIASTAFSANVGSPENVKIQFFEFWVSPNADCTGLTRVYNNASATYQDVTAGPTFGQVTVANGTYQCIAFKMNDIVKLTPDYTSDWGHCQDGVEITRDLFRVGDTSTAPDGGLINGSGSLAAPTEDDMYVYLSTQGDDTNASTAPNAPGKLSSAYVVNADKSATMVFDFTNGIEDTGAGGGGSCSPEQVVFKFR